MPNNKNGIFLKCDLCGTSFYIRPSEMYKTKRKKNPNHFCSMDCKQTYQRSHNKGYYRGVTRDGVVIREHRYVMEQHLGRKLAAWEHVHHINGNKRDNRLSNLVVLTSSQHTALHNPIQWNVSEAVGLLRKGIAMKRVCRQLGKTESAISKALKRRGITVKSSHIGGRSKLTLEQVRTIRKARKSATMLSKEYGVSVSTIYAIWRGKTWRRTSIFAYDSRSRLPLSLPYRHVVSPNGV